MILSFSVRQRLQRFAVLLYDFARSMISHLMVVSTFLSFSAHTCLDSSVLCLYFSCLSDVWWLAYLDLSGGSDRPM